MSDLSDALTQYLAMRRALGFVDRLPASLLRTFVAHVEQAGMFPRTRAYGKISHSRGRKSQRL